jgi:hypothetical protein
MSERLSSAVRSSAHGRGAGENLHARRRRIRRRVFIAVLIFFFVVFGAVIYGLQQSSVRISHVVIYGADQSLAIVATAAMRGNYLGLIPRDSIFFVPQSRIRDAIMSADPSVAAVSVFRDGLSDLSVKVDYRVPIAQWCGATPPLLTASSTQPQSATECDVFDASGFIYASSSATKSLNDFILYEPLADGVTPIGSTLPQASQLPTAFDFARQLASFGSPVTSIVVRGDEVDDYLASGTRITYVLGNEDNAFTALASARADMNLADGSVEYVDLRFSGKMYLKKTR